MVSVPPPAASSFHAWLKKVSPQYSWDWRYQRLLYEKLDSITSGRSKRLMIFMPPRHGKSELVTVRYSAWRLARDPSLNIILASYNQKLANRFSRKIRNVLADAQRNTDAQRNADALVRNEGRPGPNNPPSSDHARSQAPISPKESAIADEGVRVPRRVNTAEEWETAAGGGVRAVGAGSGVTGFGAGLIIIDDPVKNRAEAESATFRDRVWDWFNDDIYTRLEPDAPMILIQTRWHEDDLAGRLLKEMDSGGEHWDILSLPALSEWSGDNHVPIAGDTGESTALYPSASALSEPPASAGGQLSQPAPTSASSASSAFPSPSVLSVPSVVQSPDPLGRLPGQALCPERFNTEALMRIKTKLGSYSFAALYQQRPTPIEGGLFKRNWFKLAAHAPADLRWKRGYDLAVSTATSADFTASFRCAYDMQGNLYIADGFRRRIEFPEQRKYILERMRSENNTEHGIEAALHGTAFVQELRRDPACRRHAFRSVRVASDKFTRALSWANLAEEGKVYLVRGPWNDDFIEEACSFPNGSHDDQIDAVSLAVEMLSAKKYVSRGF